MSCIKYIGFGRQEGWSVRWGRRELKASYTTYALEQKAAIMCSGIEVHKQPLFTCQAKTVTDSSLTPSVVLLVFSRGTVLSIMDS